MITKRAEIEMYSKIFAAYETLYPSGGSLHIVLEDQNWDIPSIHFCYNEAIDKGDPVGSLLADFLSQMPTKYLKELRDGPITLDVALIQWGQELKE